MTTAAKGHGDGSGRRRLVIFLIGALAAAAAGGAAGRRLAIEDAVLAGFSGPRLRVGAAQSQAPSVRQDRNDVQAGVNR